MSERKYKVGDVVRTLVDIDAEGNKLFPKGTIGTITEIADYKDSLYPYKVDTNEDWWYYSADMIEPVDEGGTPKQDPCYDTISRQAVLEELPRRTMRNYFGEVVGDVVYIDDIKALPPVTPKQRTGRWVESYINQIKGCDDIGHFYVCNECGRYINLRQGEKLSDYPYCHCGAKMVKPQERSE